MPAPSREEFHQIYCQGEEAVYDLIVSLFARLDALQVEVDRLKDQISKNSSNSSKPPSSDGLNKPSKNQSLRNRSGRRPGGQPGHPGSTLKAVEHPDHIESYRLTRCAHCGEDLDTVSSLGLEKRQVFDFPKIRIEVTEHQAEIKNCPSCGLGSKASFPQHISQPVQYGSLLKSWASYLSLYQLLPFHRLQELFKDLLGHSPSPGIFEQAQKTLLQKIAPAEAIIIKQLQEAPVVHFDETGTRVDGKTQWLHSASTSRLTHYHVHPNRGKIAMDSMGILPHFRGIAVHDYWKSYLKYLRCHHSLCNAHLLRELRFIHQRYEQPWAQEMFDLLLKIYHSVKKYRLKSKQLPRSQIRAFEQNYQTLLADGYQSNPQKRPAVKRRGRVKQTPARNLLDRLSFHQEKVLAFMYDFQIPFDNNQAERDLRMMKIKQKISGSFRTENGAERFCKLRGYLSTARKNAINSIEAIQMALEGKPFIPT